MDCNHHAHHREECWIEMTVKCGRCGATIGYLDAGETETVPLTDAYVIKVSKFDKAKGCYNIQGEKEFGWTDGDRAVDAARRAALCVVAEPAAEEVFTEGKSKEDVAVQDVEEEKGGIEVEALTEEDKAEGVVLEQEVKGADAKNEAERNVTKEAQVVTDHKTPPVPQFEAPTSSGASAGLPGNARNNKALSPPVRAEVLVGNLSSDVKEVDLYRLFEMCGVIWNVRLMKDKTTEVNRGYAFVTFTRQEAAQEAVKHMNMREMKGGSHATVQVVISKTLLVVSNIPRSKQRADIEKEISDATAGLSSVILCDSPDGELQSINNCFLQYNSVNDAALAKRLLITGRNEIFGCDTIIIDWAGPQQDSKVLRVKNFRDLNFSDQELKAAFGKNNEAQIEKILKSKNSTSAFVFFFEADSALDAMQQGVFFDGAHLDLFLADDPVGIKRTRQ